MDIGTIFLGIVVLVVAWACWTYLPPPLSIIGGLVFGLLGLYLLFVGLVPEGLDSRHVEALVPFLLFRRLKF